MPRVQVTKKFPREVVIKRATAPVHYAIQFSGPRDPYICLTKAKPDKEAWCDLDLFALHTVEFQKGKPRQSWLPAMTARSVKPAASIAVLPAHSESRFLPYYLARSNQNRNNHKREQRSFLYSSILALHPFLAPLHTYLAATYSGAHLFLEPTCSGPPFGKTFVSSYQHFCRASIVATCTHCPSIRR
jgi:hypothetical protein